MNDWHADGNGDGSHADGVAVVETEERRAAHRPSLATLLTSSEDVSDKQVKDALEEGERTGEKLGEVLVRRGLVSEDRLAELLAEQWGLPFSRTDSLAVDSQAVRELKAADARRLGALPVWFERNGGEDSRRLIVAVTEPSDDRFASVRGLLGETKVGFVVVAKSALDRLLQSRLIEREESVVEDEHVEHEHEHEDNSDHDHEHAEDEPMEVVDMHEMHETHEEEHSTPDEHETPAVAEVATPDVASIIAAFETATAQLRSVEGEVSDLAAALHDAERRLAERTQALQDAEAAAKRDRATITSLEGELSQQGDLFSALKAKVADLSQTLESSV